jgi:hypothetical protein
MASKADVRRRWLGAFFLLAAIGMLIAGETFLRDRLSPVLFLVFWTMCFAFTVLAVLVAFLDVSAVRRRIRAEQRELIENTLRQLAASKGSKSGKKPPESPDNPP